MRRASLLFVLALAACSDNHGATAPTDAASDATSDVAADTALDTSEDSDTSDARDVADASDVTDASDASDVTDAADVTDASDVADVSDAPDGPRCTADTCAAHGRCDDRTGTPTCACEPGYTGPRCDACATGYFSDGRGACTNTPCDPNPCTQPDRARCTTGPMGAVCNCNPGTHEDPRGQCVPDETCTATTCNGHGTCAVEGTALRCTCASEYTGARCDACASDAHPDGMGGCTRDVCRPSPCTEPRRSVCVAVMGAARCDCDAGSHLEGDRCVVDETCTPTRCTGHGTCSVTAGRASCACAAGYTGADCATCATGYHADGRGGCTNDPCLPSPCTMPRRTVCTAMGTTAVCACDAGYHPDGLGGCTNDPCLPDPCAARNQACRNTMGAAECYTPMCNDNNPCTDDALVGGRCVNTVRANGSACTTSACTTGQTCMAGACVGGTAVRCDDGNPCTRDTCSPTAGCASTRDDTLVPDDGVACTVDRCAAGVASHTATHAVCDDGRWCTGVESCTPGATGADARGCTTAMVPVAPGASGPCATYTCDESTRSFTLNARTGMSCDDSIACTTGDVCTAAGLCAGRYVTGCSAGGTTTACTTTTSLGATVNIPTAQITGTVLLDGAPIPRTVTTAQVPSFTTSYVYLLARDTGVRHLIAAPDFSYGSTNYTLRTGTDAVAARVVPGVYDLVFTHNVGSSGTAGRQPTDVMPSGDRILRENVVIGLGPNTLDVNVTTARITGTVTLDGAPIPRTVTTAQVPSFTTSYVYLRARDTGVRHLIAAPDFSYGSTNYTLRSGTDAVAANVPPGAYDVVFTHNVGSSGTAGRQPTDVMPSGDRILRENVVIPAGASTLDVNVTTARITGTVLLDGMPIPRTVTTAQVPSFTTSYVYLQSRDTGVRHLIAAPDFSYGSTNYTLRSGTDAVAANVPPGTYDLVFTHNVGSSGTAGRQPTDVMPSGDRVIREGVVLTAGANTLDVNVTTARITGTVLLDGMPIPRTVTTAQVPSFTTSYVYLQSRDTGVRHLIAAPDFSYGTSTYTLRSGTDAVAANVPPGTYDLVFTHNVGSSGTAGRQPTDVMPSGDRILRAGVVLTAGANALDVNVTTARITGTVTLNGAPIPRTVTTAQVPSFTTSYVYLRARDTGVRHLIAAPDYSYGTSTYTLRSGTDAVAANVPPGAYDVVFTHNVGSSGTAGRQPTDVMPSGDRILRENVVIPAGASTFNVDVTGVVIAGTDTLDGAALPRTVTTAQVPSFTTSYVYLQSRDTGVRHLISAPDYSYGTSTYTLRASTDLVSAHVPPGAYDLVFTHNVGSSGTAGRQPTDVMPSGDRVLRACVRVP